MRRAVPGICTTTSRSGPVDVNKREQVGNALNANGPNLNCPPVLQSFDNADQSSVDEMNVLDRLVGAVDSLTPDQTYWFRNLQYPVQCRGRQRKQKTIIDTLCVREAGL